jgi:hypothetical protein
MEWAFGQKSTTNHAFTLSAINNLNEYDFIFVTTTGVISIGNLTFSNGINHHKPYCNW